MKWNLIFKTIFVVIATSLTIFLISCQSDRKKSSDVVDSQTSNTQSGNAHSGSSESGSLNDEQSKKNDSDSSANEKSSINKKNVDSSEGEEKNKETTYALLNSYIKSQNDEQVIKESSRLILQNPGDVKAQNALAMTYYKKNQFTLAKSILLKIVKNSKENYEVYSNLGLISMALGENIEAIKYFKKALEKKPDDNVSASNLGSIYVRENDFEKAIIALDISYRRGVKDYRVLSNYAVALAANGKNESAEAIYKAALKENNNSREILFNFANFLIRVQRKNAEGLEYIQKLKFIGVPDEVRTKTQELEQLARKDLK